MSETQIVMQVSEVLKKRFARVQIVENGSFGDEERVLLRRRNVVEALRFLKNDPDTLIDTLVDLSAIHHLGAQSCVYKPQTQGPFFEIFYLLRSSKLRYRLRISVLVPEDQSILTVTPVFSGANWLERELWDLFGIFVEGNSESRRLLLYPGFVGHPLNKTFSLNTSQPVFSKAAP